MKASIQVGNITRISFSVTEKMQAMFDGRIIHPVCSTWDMAHQFEIAARKALEEHLEDTEQGIGSFLSIDHVKPAPLGAEVVVVATITELDETTVVCEIAATVHGRVCSTGKQIQRVLPCSTISRLIDEASSQ
jgi:fluoroacetyl-CoA thioesterase